MIRSMVCLSLFAMSCGSTFEGGSGSAWIELEASIPDASNEPPSDFDRSASALVREASADVEGGSFEASSPPPSCSDAWERECMPDAAVVACAGRCGLCPRLGVQVCLAK